jgi:hypothetical protein
LISAFTNRQPNDWLKNAGFNNSTPSPRLLALNSTREKTGFFGLTPLHHPRNSLLLQLWSPVQPRFSRVESEAPQTAEGTTGAEWKNPAESNRRGGRTTLPEANGEVLKLKTGFFSEDLTHAGKKAIEKTGSCFL